MGSYQRENQVDIPLTVDETGTLFRMFGVRDTPTIVVVNGSGVIARRVEAGHANELAEAIAQLR